jgi:hypothetical protein
MRLFPEKEKMKVFMKKGLPLIFAVAWTPMVWMLLLAVLGPAMQYLFGSWQVVVAVLAVSTVLVSGSLTYLFSRYGLTIFKDKAV